MSDFITKDDLKSLIDDKSLGELKGVDKCLDFGETEVFEYLNGLYDVQEILEKQKDDDGNDIRNPKLVMVTADVVLYHAFAIIAFREMPEIRVIRYKDAVAYLEKLADGEEETSLPRKKDEDGSIKTAMIVGSEPKRKYII